MINIPPLLVDLPSCVLYARPFGAPSGGTTFKDWSPAKKTITSTSVVNSTAAKKFPPASFLAANTSNVLYTSTNIADFQIGGSTSLTISAWINAASLYYPKFFGLWGGADAYNSTTGWAYQVYFPNNNTLTFAYWNGSAGATVTGSSGYSVGNWAHLAAIKSGTTLTLYWNGSSIYSGTISASNPSSSTQFVFCNDPYGDQNHYMDEVAVWKKALPIAKLYPQTRRFIA